MRAGAAAVACIGAATSAASARAEQYHSCCCCCLELLLPERMLLSQSLRAQHRDAALHLLPLHLACCRRSAESLQHYYVQLCGFVLAAVAGASAAALYGALSHIFGFANVARPDAAVSLLC